MQPTNDTQFRELRNLTAGCCATLPIMHYHYFCHLGIARWSITHPIADRLAAGLETDHSPLSNYFNRLFPLLADFVKFALIVILLLDFTSGPLFTYRISVCRLPIVEVKYLVLCRISLYEVGRTSTPCST